MSVLKQIRVDLLQARLARTEQVKVDLLRTLVGEAEMVGKNDGNRESSDQEVKDVITKFIKNAKFVVANAPGTEAATTAQQEMDILSAYLPKQLSEMDLTDIILNLNPDVEGKNIGSVMKFLNSRYAGQFDRALVKPIMDSIPK